MNTSSFNDVSVKDSVYVYAIPYIEAARRANITDGIGNKLFNPDGILTREQLAIFVIRGLNKDADAGETMGVADETVSPYAKQYVALFMNLLPFLRSDGPFNGTLPANRRMLLLSLDYLTITICGCGPSTKQVESSM
ncbi:MULTISPECIES: S-layer homology domain-containing protein [unclassified Paenibacillus]|uniref:S-layer homology domain-containing protein n=1 Tax=unclassified Paenibacillus TaxID=185978 RepID=UPI003632ACBB